MTLPDSAGGVLLSQARAAIAALLGVEAPPPLEWEPWSERSLGSFVTLTMKSRLRGCIGTLTDHRPLSVNLVSNAMSAATKDLRFDPLPGADLVKVTIEVSVLSELIPIPWATRAEVADSLRPGIDGLVLYVADRRATFLPQVWASLSDPDLFLERLRVKVGLPPDGWESDLRLERYKVQDWVET